MSQTTTLLGGLDITVTKRDGAKETVFIRQVPVRHFPKLLESIADEYALGRIYTERENEWLDSLSPSSFEDVITKGEELNAPFFTRWWDRTRKRVESVAPGKFEQMMGLTSQTSAPTSPSVAV